jgi:hypothetical protein
MNKTKLNVDLLKRLRTRFLRMRHPQHFRMKQIAIKTDCGAAMCIIGHVLDLEGYRMRPKKNYDPETDPGIRGPDDGARSDYEFIHPQTRRPIDDPLGEAASLLHMSEESAANELFEQWEIKTPAEAAARIQELIEEAEAK